MILSIIDWIFQGIIAFSVFVRPFLLRPRSGGRAIGYPFLIVFLWGTWRMTCYDPATHNDIPGMGYIVAAFGYSVVARGLYAIRCAFLTRKARQKALRSVSREGVD
jgi:hypothetical protein